jgi:predicted nuclease of predicted toxin-antitoxin system
MARMLSNENLLADVVTALRSDGHEETWMRDVVQDLPGDRVLALEFAEERIVLAFDKDTGELAFRLTQIAETVPHGNT